MWLLSKDIDTLDNSFNTWMELISLSIAQQKCLDIHSRYMLIFSPVGL